MRLFTDGKITTKMIRGEFITYWHRWIFIFSIHLFLFASLAQSEGNTIRYQTNEEGAPGTVIGNLAKDMSLSLSHSSKTNFRMMKQFNDSFIRVRESDGELTVGERIDRERICRHTPQCLITFDVVNFSKDRYKLIHVEVEIKDINDNSPEFPNKESIVEISENAAVGSRIPLDPAVDADVGSNYIQSYQISVNSHFTIDVLLRADGVKYAELVLMKELDRETQSSYTVDLVATDGGNPYRSGSTKITIRVTDFNDNSPVFDQNSFSVSLPEDAPVGTVILDLNAVDADEGLNGEVVYGFGKQVSHEIRELFQVDNKSGRLTLRSPVDFEDKSTYELDVQGTDLGPNPTPSVCKIIIHVTDVNDNAPEISITPMTSITTGIAYISEAADKDSLVALISTLDRDSGVNSQVHCTLYGHDHFKLRQAYEDSYMIVTAATLDRERISEYNLTVMAEDFGSPPLRKITQYTIRLSDENDNAPHFTKAVNEVSVVENNAPGAYITTVEATDADLGINGKITYRLVDSLIMGSPLNTFVSLNSVSGSIYALRSFNYEVMKQLDIHIQASDGGSPQLQSTAVIRLKIVDQNDNQPSIIEPPLYKGSAEVFLPKDAPAGYVVTQIKATDADEGINAQLSYKITEGGHLGFSINKDTGKVHVSRQLTYDLADNVKVTVSVSDKGSPSLTSTAIIHLSFIEGTLPSMPSLTQNGSEELFEWDMSIAIIIVLAGSCSLLLLAIILITTICNRRKKETREGEYDQKEDVPNVENVESGHIDSLIVNHKGKVFDAHPFPEKPLLASSNAAEPGCEDGRQTADIFESNSRVMEGKLKQGYSTLPGYGKETVRPITIWKGNSFTTISARDPHISGKDSGKGDSDFNDSDSDISGDVHKKESPPTNSLWACTSECKVLGHSDRCWSPSATRPNTSMASGPHLSTFSKTASLPRDTRRENYYPAHIPKTNGLQSVYEKVQHQEFDYILVGPPTPARIQETDEISIPEYTNS
ncbi:protocadherin-8 isoform X1 [Larimichthys crocea]|uniref:protocadherin-8 isoform X1 n=1 Tax=Larimichthys crocea TaxID=215358 RepID=UPI000F5E7369|nr:protocadherin-8 isoform X1 [Larimichthys crocea]